VSNVAGALFHNLTCGLLASAPPHAGATAYWWRQLARASRSFALIADMTVALLGGGLKTKQKITGRMADALTELYLLSAVLKRYDDDGRQRADLKLVDYCAQNCLYRFDQALLGTLRNFPVRWAAWLMRPLVLPFGPRRPVSDYAGKEIVRSVLQPGEFRDRLTRDIFISNDPSDRMGLLEYTLLRTVACEDADKKLERAARKGEVRRYHNNDWIAEAETKGVLTHEEAKDLAELRDLVTRVIAVDDFDAEAVARKAQGAAAAPKLADVAGARPDRPEHIAAE
jgi:acyl-CoA dehydrogenase